MEEFEFRRGEDQNGKDVGDIEIVLQEKDENEIPVTREECLAYINKQMDSHIFVERNCSSLMSEGQIIRLSMIKEYIRDNLK